MHDLPILHNIILSEAQSLRQLSYVFPALKESQMAEICDCCGSSNTGFKNDMTDFWDAFFYILNAWTDDIVFATMAVCYESIFCETVVLSSFFW